MQVVKSFLIWEWRPGATLRVRRERRNKAVKAFLGVHLWPSSWSRRMSKYSEKAKKAGRVYHSESSGNRIP
jgi:hypothetical protein